MAREREVGICSAFILMMMMMIDEYTDRYELIEVYKYK